MPWLPRPSYVCFVFSSLHIFCTFSITGWLLQPTSCISARLYGSGEEIGIRFSILHGYVIQPAPTTLCVLRI